MLWCLWCLVAAAPIDVPSGIRRVLSSANAAAALGLDDQVQGDRHRIRAAYREAMLAVHPDKHIANPSRSVRAAALEAAVTLSEARAELLATGSTGACESEVDDNVSGFYVSIEVPRLARWPAVALVKPSPL